MNRITQCKKKFFSTRKYIRTVSQLELRWPSRKRRCKIQRDPDRRYTSRVNICCSRVSPLTRGSWIAYRLSVSPGAAPSRRSKASELSQRREQRGKRRTVDAAAPTSRSRYQRPTVPFLAAELESARTENLYLRCIPTKLCKIKSLVVVANQR